MSIFGELKMPLMQLESVAWRANEDKCNMGSSAVELLHQTAVDGQK